MIVKNESKIITRALDSIKDYVDYYVISDTGSTDGTQQIIKQYFDNLGIAGEIHQNEWKNFGHNRTVALKLARGHCDYLLLMDADMVLEVRDKQWRSKLKADIYTVTQKAGNVVYYNVRLVSSAIECRYVGPTHEYLAPSDSDIPSTKTDLIYFDDRSDGFNRVDKFSRDIKLLKEGLKDEPDNGRYCFYIARSYLDMGDLESALIWFKKRIAIGGWVEEIYYSKFHLGQIYLRLEDEVSATYHLLDAYEFRPQRGEALYELAKHYRINRKYNLSYMLSKTGMQISYPKNDLLFVDPCVYKYWFQYEISICASYLGKTEEGLLMSDYVLMLKDTDVGQHVKDNVHQNLFFYQEQPLIRDFEGCRHADCDIPHEIEFEHFQLETELTDPQNHLCNPAIVYSKRLDQFVINIREVDYSYDSENNNFILHKVHTTDSYNHIVAVEKESLTRGWSGTEILQLDTNLLEKPSAELLGVPTYPNHRLGYDDMRLFEFGGRMYGVASSTLLNPEHSSDVIMFTFSKYSLHSFEKVVRLHGYEDHKWQKNWMSLIADDKLFFVYSFEPFIILEPDLETGLCAVHQNSTSGLDLSRFRGGSGFVPFDCGYLGMVHEVIFRDNRRYYFNRFVYLQEKRNGFVIQSFSKPLWLTKKGIEYVTGLAIVDGDAYISFGIDEMVGSANILKIQEDSISRLLTLSRRKMVREAPMRWHMRTESKSPQN